MPERAYLLLYARLLFLRCALRSISSWTIRKMFFGMMASWLFST
ncbi:hypothetical protein [Hornefia butyriciproducens]